MILNHVFYQTRKIIGNLSHVYIITIFTLLLKRFCQEIYSIHKIPTINHQNTVLLFSLTRVINCGNRKT